MTYSFQLSASLLWEVRTQSELPCPLSPASLVSVSVTLLMVNISLAPTADSSGDVYAVYLDDPNIRPAIRSFIDYLLAFL